MQIGPANQTRSCEFAKNGLDDTPVFQYQIIGGESATFFDVSTTTSDSGTRVATLTVADGVDLGGLPIHEIEIGRVDGRNSLSGDVAEIRDRQRIVVTLASDDFLDQLDVDRNERIRLAIPERSLRDTYRGFSTLIGYGDRGIHDLFDHQMELGTGRAPKVSPGLLGSMAQAIASGQLGPRPEIYKAALYHELAVSIEYALANSEFDASVGTRDIEQLGAAIYAVRHVLDHDVTANNRISAHYGRDLLEAASEIGHHYFTIWSGLGVNSESIEIDDGIPETTQYGNVYESGLLQLTSHVWIDVGQPALVETMFLNSVGEPNFRISPTNAAAPAVIVSDTFIWRETEDADAEGLGATTLDVGGRAYATLIGALADWSTGPLPNGDTGGGPVSTGGGSAVDSPQFDIQDAGAGSIFDNLAGVVTISPAAELGDSLQHEIDVQVVQDGRTIGEGRLTVTFAGHSFMEWLGEERSQTVDQTTEPADFSQARELYNLLLRDGRFSDLNYELADSAAPRDVVDTALNRLVVIAAAMSGQSFSWWFSRDHRERVYTAVSQVLDATERVGLEAVADQTDYQDDRLGRLGHLLAESLAAEAGGERGDMARSVQRLLADHAGSFWTVWSELGVNSRPHQTYTNDGGIRQSSFYSQGILTFSDGFAVDLGRDAYVEWTRFSSESSNAGGGGGSGTTQIDAVADNYVEEGQTGPYSGSALTMEVANGATNDRESFLRFDLSNESQHVTSATVDVKVKLPAASIDNQIELVLDNTWDENALEWLVNQPASVGLPLDTQTVTTAGQIVSFDVASAVRQALALGDMNFTTGLDPADGPSTEGDVNAFDLAIKDIAAYLDAYDDNVNYSSDILDRGDANRDSILDKEDADGFLARHGRLSADFDVDGDVDGDDFLIWKTGFGTGTIWHRDGDADFDAIVDGNDFLIWQNELSETNPSAAEAISFVISQPTETTAGEEVSYWTSNAVVGDQPFLNLTQTRDLVIKE